MTRVKTPKPDNNFVQKGWLTRRTTKDAAVKRYPILADERLLEFWGKMRWGDELWYFRTPTVTWQGRMGREGVAIVRHGKTIAHFSAKMN